MAIPLVITFHAGDGRQSEQVENLKAVKRLVERGSGTFRDHRQLFGSQVSLVVVVSQYEDWNAFVKVGIDLEFSQLVERIRGSANPAADLVGENVYEELTI